MRKFLPAFVGAAVLAAGLTTPAAAHSVCHKSLTAIAHHKSYSMHGAYAKAIAAWVEEAEAKYDSEFDWYYSGDRSIACKWKTGHDIICAATAIPCER